MAMEMKMGNVAMRHDEEVRVFRFDWPVDGLGRGFRVELRDSAGAPLPPSVLHHLIAINFDRRQFAYSATDAKHFAASDDRSSPETRTAGAWYRRALLTLAAIAVLLPALSAAILTLQARGPR